MAMLGVEMPKAEAPGAEPGNPAEAARPAESKKPGVKDVLRGLFGR